MKTTKKPVHPQSKLPLEHPDFRYPPSKNPYVEKLGELAAQSERLVFSGNDTEAHRGSWRDQFPGSRKTPFKELHVEIGCNAGHVIVEWAKQDPSKAFIGIDWKMKAIHRAAEKAAKRKLENMIFMRAHALRLNYIFAPGEIDFLALYFPDPWAKKSQLKNRYINEANLRMIHTLLKPGGVFHIKTDHRGYFDWMEEHIAKTSELWRIHDRTYDLHAGVAQPEKLDIPQVTLFEKLFIKDGIKINSVKLEKR